MNPKSVSVKSIVLGIVLSTLAGMPLIAYGDPGPVSADQNVGEKTDDCQCGSIQTSGQSKSFIPASAGNPSDSQNTVKGAK